MSVDTYLKGKDTSSYQLVQHDDVAVFLAPSLVQWASTVTVGTKGSRVRRRLDIGLEHEHGPACRH